MDPALTIYVGYLLLVLLVLAGDYIAITQYEVSLTAAMNQYNFLRVLLCASHIIMIVSLYEHLINDARLRLASHGLRP